jgi:hypothetical protein
MGIYQDSLEWDLLYMERIKEFKYFKKDQNYNSILEKYSLYQQEKIFNNQISNNNISNNKSFIEAPPNNNPLSNQSQS